MASSSRSGTPELLRTRIQARLEELDINPFEAARRGGLERNFVNDILVGKKQSVRGKNLARLCAALDVTADYLLTQSFGEAPARGRTTPRSAAGLVQVPEYDVRLSAGGGQLVDAENIIDTWQFSRRYLVEELRLNPASLGVVTVEGDSMYPPLRTGDRVLVDHSDRNPAKPGIYAIWDSNATVVKRLEKVPASDPPMVVLISDNTLHNTYTVPAELVNVIGRVVWFARRL